MSKKIIDVTPLHDEICLQLNCNFEDAEATVQEIKNRIKLGEDMVELSYEFGLSLIFINTLI